MLFCAVSRADQAADVAAILDLLRRNVTVNNNGFYTVPLDTDDPEYYLSELLSYQNKNVANWQYETVVKLNQGLFSGQVPYLSLILAALQAQQAGDTNLVEFLRPYLTSFSDLGTSIDTSLTMSYGTLNSISTDVLSIDGNVISMISALDSDRWRVHDSELQTALLDALSNNGSAVDGISSSLGGISESASGASEYLSSINSQLDGIPKNWLTKAQLEDVIEHADEPPHDEPPDDSAEKEQAARSAQYEWSQAESTSYSNKWELASWEYTKMLPGNASIVSDNPSDNPGGTGFSPDDSGLPLFSRAIVAEDFGMSIDSSVIEPNDYPIFMSYYREFRVRWASIFHAVWDFIGAFMVFFIARREWKYYMGVGDNAPEVETDAGGIF